MNAWIETMSAIPWFSALGDSRQRSRAEALAAPMREAFGIPNLSFRWLTFPDAAEFIRNYDITSSSMWPILFELPERIRAAAAANGSAEALPFAADDVAEAAFHAAYDGAYPALQAFGEESVRNAVCAAMFVAGLTAGWELAGESPEANPLRAVLALFELGHWPLGMFEGQFILL